MSADNSFTRENLDSYIKELAKEFRKLNGNKFSCYEVDGRTEV